MRISPGIDPAIPSAHESRVMVLRYLFLVCLAAASLTATRPADDEDGEQWKEGAGV